MPVTHHPRALVLFALTLASLRCTPDFDSLKSGHGAGGAAGSAADGGESPGGAETRGDAGESLGGAASGAGGAADGGSSAGASSTDGGEAGAAGAAPDGCVWKPSGSSHYDGFDGGLDGQGFDGATTTSSSESTLGATATSAFDDSVGKTCLGSLNLKALFKGYVDGQQGDESAVVDLRFADASWAGATKLHAWVRVSPKDAPLTGVRFFVMSGSSFLYDSILDENGFASGQWYELVLPLKPGASYEPKVVHRVGVSITLRRAGTANNPPVAPSVDVWIDDVWVE